MLKHSEDISKLGNQLCVLGTQSTLSSEQSSSKTVGGIIGLAELPVTWRAFVIPKCWHTTLASFSDDIQGLNQAPWMYTSTIPAAPVTDKSKPLGAEYPSPLRRYLAITKQQSRKDYIQTLTFTRDSNILVMVTLSSSSSWWTVKEVQLITCTLYNWGVNQLTVISISKCASR